MSILSRRLAAQRISTGLFDSPAEVVSWLGAVQAQDYLGALWAIGVRTKNAREEDVEQSLADRRIVRTWPMRGTLHFLAAEDARWMTELLAPRKVTAAAARMRSLGIDHEVLTRARRVLVRELEGGRMLTRAATYSALSRAGVATDDQRGIHILWCLAHELLICFGPRSGKQQTFVLFDEWLPRARSLPREEALAELAHRYFRSHGPAALRDFGWWSGLGLKEASHAIVLASGRLRKESTGRVDHWFADLPTWRAARSDRAYALPAFDQLLVGYTDRSAALDDATLPRVLSGGVFRPFLLAGGRVVGTWKRRLAGTSVVCSVDPFARAGSTANKAWRPAFERYAAFVGRDLRSQSNT